MKNKLWTFGDSFTEGVLYNYQKELIDIFGYEPKNWVDIIADKLNLEVKNISFGGLCNYEIISNILQNIPNIQKGDLVIISDTLPQRILGFNNSINKITSINTESLLKETEEFELENKTILINYVHDFILKHEENWIEYWKLEFKKIVDIFLSNEIECYFWNHLKWQEFSTLFQETHKKIVDDHWGPQGCQDFSKYLLDRIYKKKYYNEIQFSYI
jgi:hypothetical protein